MIISVVSDLASLYPKPKDLYQFVLDYIYDSSYKCYTPQFHEYPADTGVKVKTIKEMIDM